MQNQIPYIIGIDLGKNTFHLCAMNKQGKLLYQKKLSRIQLKEFVINSPKCTIAMEACPGSQYWGRLFHDNGCEVKIIPAQFVKPYLKSNKNDFNDAAAIAEAGSRGTMRFVPLKTKEQLELQAIHRIRQRFITERTATINQMRALLLEQGVVVPIGRKIFEKKIPLILEDAENDLTFSMRALIHQLRERWRHLDKEIDSMTQQLKTNAQASALCQRISTVPGVGPIVATAMIAAIGSGQHFRKARDLSAWLGLVPKQYSTGGKSNLKGISKRGNVYLRTLVVQGAKALKIHMKRDASRLGEWVYQLEQKHHHHVVVIALANKIMRICWKVLNSGKDYECYPVSTA